MAYLEHPTDIRNLIANTVTDQIDGGGAAGKLIFFEANTALASEALATLTFTYPNAFDPASNGVAAANTITANTETLANTVTWFQVQDSSGTVIFEGDVTSDDVGTGAIQLSSTTLGTGDTVSVSSLTYTAPN